MALTNEEKARILERLEQLSDAARDAAIATLDSFVNWLKRSLNYIYEKIKDSIRNIWNYIRDLIN